MVQKVSEYTLDAVCPFRIVRKASLIVENEFSDLFADCMGTTCPCFSQEGKEQWCYREQLRFPLNEAAKAVNRGMRHGEEDFE